MTAETPLVETVEADFLFFGDGRGPDARDTSWNLSGLYLVQRDTLGSFCNKLTTTGWEYPKNSGPDPVLVASLPLQDHVT